MAMAKPWRACQNLKTIEQELLSVLFQWQGKLHLIGLLYPVLHCAYHVINYLPLGAGPQEWGTEEWHLWWIFIPHSLHWRPCLKNPQIKLPQWSHQVGLLKLVLLKQCDSSTVSSFWSLWTGLFRSSISTIYSIDTKYLSESKHTVPVGFELIHKLAEIATYLFLIFCTDSFNWWCTHWSDYGTSSSPTFDFIQPCPEILTEPHSQPSSSRTWERGYGISDTQYIREGELRNMMIGNR